MSQILANLLLADGGFFGDSRTWIIVIFAIVSALGGLFKKQAEKKQQRDRTAGGRTPPARPPVPPRRAPAPPAPPARREPTRLASTPPEARRVPTEGPRRRPGDAYTLEDLRAAAQRPRPTRVERRPPPPETPVAPAPEEPVVEATPVALVEPAHAADQGVPVRAVQSRIQRLLQERSGLQAGIVLSEILSRPVALRDDHLE